MVGFKKNQTFQKGMELITFFVIYVDAVTLFQDVGLP